MMRPKGRSLLSTIMSLVFGLWPVMQAHADGQRATTSDRIVVELKGIRVALPILAADRSQSSMSSWVQLTLPISPSSILSLSVYDLIQKPEESRRHIDAADYVAVVVYGGTGSAFNDVTNGVARVTSVSLVSGRDANCESWKRDYRKWRDKSLDGTADAAGWLAQEKIGDFTGFVKFADDNSRPQSRYHAVTCDPFGYCTTTVCRNNLSIAVKFNGTGKSNGFDQPIETSRFDGALGFANEVLSQLLPGQNTSLSYGADD